MKGLWYILCYLLLLPGVGHAQERYNRWDARPAPNVPTASAQERGTKTLHTKSRQDSLQHNSRIVQDSLRRIASVAKLPPLHRGIGQRLKNGTGIPDDTQYYVYCRNLIQYPQEAMSFGTEGKVVVRLMVNAAGQVVNSTIIENTIPASAPGYIAMTKQALSMMRLLRFEPASQSSEEELKVNYKFR